MKKIIPMNCTQIDFAKHLIHSGLLTPERYAAAIIDNIEYPFKDRPPRANNPWSMAEDYDVVCLLLNFKTVDFISKIVHRSRTAVLSRMITLMGTSNYAKIWALSEDDKEKIRTYFYHCMVHKVPYSERILILETVEMIHFLKDCGIDADDFDGTRETSRF